MFIFTNSSACSAAFFLFTRLFHSQNIRFVCVRTPPLLWGDQTTKEKVAIKKITKNHLQPHDHDALKSEVALLKECAGQANVLAYKDFFEEVHIPSKERIK